MPTAEELYEDIWRSRRRTMRCGPRMRGYKKQFFGRKSEKLAAAPASPESWASRRRQSRAEAPDGDQYERRGPEEKRPIPAEVFADLPVVETIEIVPEEVKADPGGLRADRRGAHLRGGSSCSRSW
jgi:hypothetical protein